MHNVRCRILDNVWGITFDHMVCVCIRYTYKWLLYVRAHTHFLVCEFQVPMGTYSDIENF